MVTAGCAPYLGGVEVDGSADQAARGALFFGMIPGQSAVEADVVQKLAGAVGHFGHVPQVNRTAVRCADDQILQVLRVRDELSGLDAHILVVAVEGSGEHAGVGCLNGAAQVQRRNAVGSHAVRRMAGSEVRAGGRPRHRRDRRY